MEGDEVVSGTIQSAGTFDYSRVLVVDRSDKYEDAPTVDQLNNDAVNYINANRVGIPKVSLTVSFANLEQVEEYKAIRQSIALCDYVTVQFEKLGVSAVAKVIRTDYDVLNERYISVSIGESRTSLADTIVGISSTLQNVPSTTQMAQAISVMTAAITGANGGSVRLLDTNDDGMPDTLYIADNPDPALATKVWRFNYAGWGASSTGYAGPYTMGATFEQGFLADFITAGTLNADNINVTNINGQNIKAGTVGSTPLATSAVTASKIDSGAVINSKLGDSAVSESKIGTDAVINRCIASGQVYPTTCNGTINGYFADVIEFNQLRAGAVVVDYLSAGVVSWDRFRLANGGTSYVMYRDASTGALFAHT